jgi:hypothetical protein
VIVPDVCIGGIGIYDTSTRVLAQWGKPVRTTRTIGLDVRWHYKSGTVLLTSDHTAATATTLIVLGLTTRDPRERTRAGIGTGSTLRQIKAAYPQALCGPGWCGIETHVNRETTLTLRRGRVVEVSVGLISTDYNREGRPDPRCSGS